MRTWLLTKAPDVRRYILLGVAVGVPIVFLRSVNDPFNVPKLSLLLIGTALALALKVAEITQGASMEGLKRLLLPAAFVALPLFISWILSDYRGWALFGYYGRFQGLLPYLVVIAYGILVADAFAGRALTLAWSLAYCGGLVGAYALLQSVGGDPFAWSFPGQNVNAALSTLGNPNFTGGFCAIVLPVAIGLWVIEPKKRRRALQLGVLIAVGWIVPTSQGGWAAGLAGAVMVLAFLYGPRLRHGKKLGAALALAIGVGMVVLVGASLVADLPLPGTTIRARGDWWVAASRMAGEAPILGHGPNTFAVEGVQHRTERDALTTNYDFANDPHSVFFAFLVAAGAIGALGYLALIAWTARESTRVDERNLVAPLFVGAATAYFAQSLVSIDELSLRVACWTVLGGLAASLAPIEAKAAASKTRRGRKRSPRREPLRAPVAVGAIALAALAAVWWSLQFVVADGRVLQAAKLFALNQPDAAQTEYERALAFRDEFQYRSKYAFDLGEAANAAQDPVMLEKAVEYWSYLDSFPEVTRIIEQARILAAASAYVEGGAERAVELYERAINLDPLNPQIEIELRDLEAQLLAGIR